MLLLTDPVESFWVTMAPEFDGKPFKSVTQGAAELADVALPADAAKPDSETSSDIDALYDAL